MAVLLKNNVSSTLATAITASDTAIVVADGSQFPSPTGGDYFYATLVSPAGTTEIVKVTARVSNSLTVVRAQDGSSAASFQVGALVEMRANAASVTDLVDEHDQASEISIADAGGYYTATDVEGALQEAAQAATTKYTQGGSGAVVRTVAAKLGEFVSVDDFGADPSAAQATNDTAFADALTYCAANGKGLFIPQRGYQVGPINLNGVEVFGQQYSAFGSYTLISSATSGQYAVTLNNGSLSYITIGISGGGNGIDAASVNRRIGLEQVMVESTAGVTPGSIGVSFGSDASPGVQAIACTFNHVVARNFDTCFFMRYYSNTNVYNDFYALNTATGNPGLDEASHGFLIEGRGGTYINIRAESLFDFAVETTSQAQMNTFITPWSEGTNTNYWRLNGVDQYVFNPFYGCNFETISANNKVVGGDSANTRLDAFRYYSNNAVKNAEFTNNATGWSGGAFNSTDKIFGLNTYDLNSNASGVVNALYLLNDPTFLEKAKGKVVTMVMFGEQITPYGTGSAGGVRWQYVNGSGSTVQLAQGQRFPIGSVGYSMAKSIVPADATNLRIGYYAAGESVSTTTARITLPMVFIGQELYAPEPKRLTDGPNIVYGNMTFSGGGWNTAHVVLGAYHLWVDSTGDLRIKSGAPTSDTDGTVVGTQS